MTAFGGNMLRVLGATLVVGLSLVSQASAQMAAPAPAEVAAPPPLGDAEELGHGTYAPLGGAGGPPRRPARKLPVERDGATHYVAVEAIVAVQANAHYAYIFDGSSKLFCPLAIGQIDTAPA